jgi:hypothetical protein
VPPAGRHELIGLREPHHGILDALSRVGVSGVSALSRPRRGTIRLNATVSPCPLHRGAASRRTSSAGAEDDRTRSMRCAGTAPSKASWMRIPRFLLPTRTASATYPWHASTCAAKPESAGPRPGSRAENKKAPGIAPRAPLLAVSSAHSSSASSAAAVSGCGTGSSTRGGGASYPSGGSMSISAYR